MNLKKQSFQYFEELYVLWQHFYKCRFAKSQEKPHEKITKKRFNRVNKALFLSLSNAFEEQKFIPKISPKIFWSAPCFPKIVCGGQCTSHPMFLSLSSVLFCRLVLVWMVAASHCQPATPAPGNRDTLVTPPIITYHTTS